MHRENRCADTSDNLLLCRARIQLIERLGNTPDVRTMFIWFELRPLLEERSFGLLLRPHRLNLTLDNLRNDLLHILERGRH